MASDDEARKLHKKISRLRAKFKAGKPLDLEGHEEGCICYDCLWGENKFLRSQAALPITDLSMREYRDRTVKHPRRK